jgi:hypothetical protein
MSLSESKLVLSMLMGGWILLLHVFPDRAVAQQTNATGSPTPSPQAIPLNPIVVTETIPHSETEIIAQQITEQAANLETVESREQIARYPDVTLGDSIRRLPGVGAQYNQGEGLYVSVRGIDPNLVQRYIDFLVVRMRLSVWA